jgi:D-threo-aldose 1-dehydrogenase
MKKLSPIVFGTSCLGNLYREIPFETKVEIVAEWFKAFDHPVIDSAGKYGAGLSLECIGKALKALGKMNGDLTISVKLGWRRSKRLNPGEEQTFEPGAWKGIEYDAMQDISYNGILRCYEEAKDLLGGFPIDLVSVHDPDEYIFNAEKQRGGGIPRAKRAAKRAQCGVRRDDEDSVFSMALCEIKDAYRALFELKARGEVESVGIGSKDWRAIEMLWREGVRFDWAMFACQPTLLVHPPELVSFVNELKSAGVTLIDSAVFNGGFLLGSDMLDYRKADPEKDAEAFAFRERYLDLCRHYGLDPAAPAVQYAYRLGFDSVALNTSSPKRILQNASYASVPVPDGFWREIEGWSV